MEIVWNQVKFGTGRMHDSNVLVFPGISSYHQRVRFGEWEDSGFALLLRIPGL